jgi:hypothetical protein
MFVGCRDGRRSVGIETENRGSGKWGDSAGKTFFFSGLLNVSFFRCNIHPSL